MTGVGRTAHLGPLLLGLGFALGGGSALAAQEQREGPRSPVLTQLQGCWVGSGVLLGRPAQFEMVWEMETASDFALLTFRNAWTEEDGSSTSVLSARATLLTSASPLIGVWIDDRPARLRLEATLTDSSLVTRWYGEEEGRTEYVVRSPDVVAVRDVVLTADGERTFGEATYRPGAAGPEACP